MLQEKLHFGRVLSVLIFVGMIVGVVVFEAYNKVYLLVACVCVCVSVCVCCVCVCGERERV